ncbi:MAG: HNH endonuclease [Moraxellaceae bacterium]|nr:HNH endonuclease [Moraxellaceae bacterium]
MANWNREQLLVALNLYCQMDFGKFHQSNPRIMAAAKLIGRTPSALAMKLCNMASLDPAITASGRKGLQGASALDRSIWNEFQKSPDEMAYESQIMMDELAAQDAELAPLSSTMAVEEPVPSYYSGNATAMVVVRRKQQFFRNAILSSYESRCCMSGISHPKLLVASHIVPWAKDEHNRLNPANGLCLSALHDKAFDQGLITVTPSLTIQVSDVLRETEKSASDHAILLGLHGKLITPPHKLSPHAEFLSYHNEHVFQH